MRRAISMISVACTAIGIALLSTAAVAQSEGGGEQPAGGAFMSSYGQYRAPTIAQPVVRPPTPRSRRPRSLEDAVAQGYLSASDAANMQSAMEGWR